MNSGGPIHDSMVPSCTPSIIRGIDPSWLAGKTWGLIRPPVRCSSRAPNRLHHSCCTSFSVAVAHLKGIVWAAAGRGARALVSIAARPRSKARVAVMVVSFSVLDEASEEQRQLREERDRDQGEGVDADERHQPRNDLRDRDAEH